MSLGCDYLSILTLFLRLLFSTLPTRYSSEHIFILGLLLIMCHVVPATLCLCLPYFVTEIHLCPLSSSGRICYLGLRIGAPLGNMCMFYHWPRGQSISDFPCHPCPYLQAGVKGCNWGIREQVRALKWPLDNTT